MGMCFVFTPQRPKLYTLNTAAWLVMTLCDGRRGAEVVSAYASHLSSRITSEEARDEVSAAIGDLEGKGIVARVSPSRRAGEK